MVHRTRYKMPRIVPKKLKLERILKMREQEEKTFHNRNVNVFRLKTCGKKLLPVLFSKLHTMRNV